MTANWNGNGADKGFKFAFDGRYLLEDVHLSVGGDDQYRLEYSRDDINWFALFTVLASHGGFGSGMDTMSTVLDAPHPHRDRRLGNTMKLTIFGTGYVGLVTGARFAEVGHTAACMEVDQAKLGKLIPGVIPISRDHLSEKFTPTALNRRKASPRARRPVPSTCRI